MADKMAYDPKNKKAAALVQAGLMEPAPVGRAGGARPEAPKIEKQD